MKRLIVYVHGKGGSAQEAEHYKSLFFDRFYTQNAAYSGTDFSPSFSPKFLSESRTE